MSSRHALKLLSIQQNRVVSPVKHLSSAGAQEYDKTCPTEHGGCLYYPEFKRSGACVRYAKQAYLAELTMVAASEGGPMGAHTIWSSSRLTCVATSLS